MVEVGERQKRNLQALQDIAGSRGGFLIHQAANSGATLLPGQVSSASLLGAWNAVDEAPLRYSEPLPSFDANNAELPAGEDLPSRVMPLVTPTIDPSPTSQTMPTHSIQKLRNEKRISNCNISGLRQPAASTLLSPESLLEAGKKEQVFGLEADTLEEEQKLNALLKKFAVEEILKAGIKALSQDVSTDLSDGHEWQEQDTRPPSLRTDKIILLQNASQESFHPPLPNIYKNNIRLKQLLFAAACVTNASVVGLTLNAANCDYEISPFFQESISEAEAKMTCFSSFQGLKEHLRPCVSQVMRAHHPYIDVLPFPTFRDRVIKLAYADEPMIDEDDLCNDLENDGLICWGSSLGGGTAATGSGAPWDIRSWEAQPWFLKKWWILIGGAEGELYKQSRWWSEMRGERACYPW